MQTESSIANFWSNSPNVVTIATGDCQLTSIIQVIGGPTRQTTVVSGQSLLATLFCVHEFIKNNKNTLETAKDVHCESKNIEKTQTDKFFESHALVFVVDCNAESYSSQAWNEQWLYHCIVAYCLFYQGKDRCSGAAQPTLRHFVTTFLDQLHKPKSFNHF